MALWALAAALAGAPPAHAHDRWMRRIGAQEGLMPSSVSALGQDDRGIMWIGTLAGLHRYDGRAIRRWAAAIAAPVVAIRPAGQGTLFVRDEAGRVFAVDAVREAAAPVMLDGRPLDDTSDIAVLDGELWIARADGVRRRSASGLWSAPVPGPVHISRLRSAPDAIYAASRDTIWRIDRTGAAVLAGHAERLDDVLAMPDGSLRVTQFTGEVVAIDHGVNRLLALGDGGRALALRGDTLWVLTAYQLLGLAPGRAQVTIGRDEGLRSGSTMLVDREGALWLGTYEGVVVLPEPDTEIWSDFDGVTDGVLSVRVTDEGHWITTWGGLLWVARGGRRAVATGQTILAAVCPDGRGGWWAMGARELVHRTAGRYDSWPLPELDRWKGGECAVMPDGTAWSHVADRIVQVTPDGVQRWFATPATRDDPISRVYVDRRRRIWIVGDQRVCRAGPEVPLDARAWTCDRIDGARVIRSVIETDAGTIWLATEPAGVQRFDEATATWSVIAGSRALATGLVQALAPSPRGGVWLAGAGILMRVRERPDLAAGWEVVERPTGWHGLASSDATAVFEEPGGDLWIAQPFGLHRVPRAVRDLRAAPPAIALLDVAVDGEPRDAADLELAPGSHQIELGFAAPSYRDPQHLRYRVRTGASWSAPTDNPALRLVDLSPGAHRVEVAASLDGERWSAVPAWFAVAVARPWYLRWWAIALAGALLIGVGVALQRVRSALRWRLARQRHEIAMDLHDEMGSGLGSIGILAELASSDGVADPNRREAAAQIAETAGELGAALGDIVWSLRDRAATLDALVGHLVERARRLFPDETGVLVLALEPDVPAIPLAIATSRHVLRIALEALHNAARHAHATRVTLGVARASRQAWRLWVHDDGGGLGGATPNGNGLASMQQRAAAIGATLAIESPDAGGTRITLVFDAAARPASHRHASDGRP